MIDFPNNPNEDDIYPDNNGRSWLFKNGYWQEIIPSFSVDLLRDVVVIDNTKTIIFVDAYGTASSVSTDTDFPFILSDNSVDNIPFAVDGLKVYLSDNTIEYIDIIVNVPSIGDMLYWNGTIWIAATPSYNTSNITEFPTNQIIGDILIWSVNEFIAVPDTNFLPSERPYDKKYFTEIDQSGFQLISDYDIWVKCEFDRIPQSNDLNMADLVNHRIVCTSAGSYRLYYEWMVDFPTAQAGNKYFYPQTRFYVDDKNAVNKFTWKSGAISYMLRYGYKQNTFVTVVNLEVGDYMWFDYMRGWNSYYSLSFISSHYNRMSMQKICDITPTITTSNESIIDIIGSEFRPTLVNDLQYDLDDGTYQLIPTKGRWTSLTNTPSPTGSNCDINGLNCTEGSFWNLKISLPEIGDISINNPNGLAYDDDTALSDVLTLATTEFILTYKQTISITLDSTNTAHYHGVSFRLIKII